MEGKAMNSDPFARAKMIRAGKLDNEIPNFEELTGWLERMPMTWLPAFLMACVHQCVVRDVFQGGGLVECVKGAEERAKDPTSILRDEIPKTAHRAQPPAAGESAPVACADESLTTYGADVAEKIHRLIVALLNRDKFLIPRSAVAEAKLELATSIDELVRDVMPD
jgi:hypothetical protein